MLLCQYTAQTANNRSWRMIIRLEAVTWTQTSGGTLIAFQLCIKSWRMTRVRTGTVPYALLKDSVKRVCGQRVLEAMT